MERFDLDTPLFQWQNGSGLSEWTINSSFLGLFICGANGSGKSSGSAAYFAKKLLRQGYGGVVLTCKKDECETWMKYLNETDRLGDAVVIEPGGKYSFDFMEYLSAQSGDGNSITDNLVQTLTTVIQAGEEKTSGKADDFFWQASLTMLISSIIDISMLAYNKVGIQQMYDIVQSLPSEEAQEVKENAGELNHFEKAFGKARDRVKQEIDDWYRSFPYNKTNGVNGENFETVLMEAVPNARLLKILDQFFFETFKTLSGKTKSIILFSFSSFLFKLLREPMYSLFCNGKINVKPEDCLDGKVIILNVPVKVFGNSGRDSQLIFKHLFQMAMEVRDVKSNNRPVMIFADECQFFTTENDQVFQATARSSRVATVYITQNLQQLYASMGGTKFMYRVKSLLSTLNSKLFHLNADYETNEYASQLIGDVYVEDESQSINFGKETSQGRTKSYKLERLVRPEEFMTFRCGGKKNDFIVDGILHVPGPPIMNGNNFKRMAFNQLK